MNARRMPRPVWLAVLGIAAALIGLASVPVVAQASDQVITARFTYKGKASLTAVGEYEGATASPTPAKTFWNAVGRGVNTYTWTMSGTATLRMNSADEVQKVLRVRWDDLNNHGSNLVEPGWNCVDIGSAVYGEAPKEPCNFIDPTPVEDNAISLYRPWAQSATGGLPTVVKDQDGFTMIFETPLNAAAVEDKGVYGPNPSMGLTNASTDWGFPIFGAPDYLPCVYNHPRLEKKWAKVNRPLISWEFGKSHGTVSKEFNLNIPTEDYPANLCEKSQNVVYVGEPASGNQYVETEVQLKILH